MTRRVESIIFHAEERSMLERQSRERNIPSRLVERAQIIQLSAERVASKEIAQQLQNTAIPV
jgi:hypothetical protein